jgi:hypothetical protein
MPYLPHLYVFALSGVQHILCCVFVLFVFVLCLCCLLIWIVNFLLPFRYSLTFIYRQFEVAGITLSRYAESQNLQAK